MDPLDGFRGPNTIFYRDTFLVYSTSALIIFTATLATFHHPSIALQTLLSLDIWLSIFVFFTGSFLARLKFFLPGRWRLGWLLPCLLATTFVLSVLLVVQTWGVKFKTIGEVECNLENQMDGSDGLPFHGCGFQRGRTRGAFEVLMARVKQRTGYQGRVRK